MSLRKSGFIVNKYGIAFGYYNAKKKVGYGFANPFRMSPSKAFSRSKKVGRLRMENALRYKLRR